MTSFYKISIISEGKATQYVAGKSSFLSHHWASILILTLQLNSCVTLDMLLNLSLSSSAV